MLIVKEIPGGPNIHIHNVMIQIKRGMSGGFVPPGVPRILLKQKTQLGPILGKIQEGLTVYKHSIYNQKSTITG